MFKSYTINTAVNAVSTKSSQTRHSLCVLLTDIDIDIDTDIHVWDLAEPRLWMFAITYNFSVLKKILDNRVKVSMQKVTIYSRPRDVCDI